MESRHIAFNFPALLEAALKVTPGANSVLNYEKLEGGFNRAFILHLNNDSKLVARIPFRHAGPQRLATHSEVATLSYCSYDLSFNSPVTTNLASCVKTPPFPFLPF
jgi:hypothetical protein